MKNRKSAQHLIWGLALCLLGQYGVVPVYGEEPTNRTQRNGVATSDIGLDLNDGSTPVPVEMNANIIASSASASLPADEFKFAVNPAQEFDISKPPTQITSLGVTVVNRSVVLIKLETASVPEVEDVKFSDKFSDYVEQSFQLVDRMSGVGPSEIAILVLGAQSKQYSSSEDLRRYAIHPGRIGIFVTEMPAEQETVVKPYGRVASDFYGKYEFTIKPTLKISVARAD